MHAIAILFSAFGTAFIITHLVIPVIIHLACAKGLVAKPNERSSHTGIVPNLGGLGIFMGFILSFMLYSNVSFFPSLQYFLFATILIFFIGMKDDISAVAAGTKFLGLTLAVTILVVLGDIRITSFHDILGITDLHPIVSILFTIFVFLVIINAFNLIDGINGLCGTLTITSLLAFGTWFWFNNSNSSFQLLILIASVVGSVGAFLRFNYTPAKIFMGDTGSLMLGFIVAFCTVLFIEHGTGFLHPVELILPPVVAIGFIAIPLADMFKVFLIRIYRKQNPFKADKRHVHHIMVDLGLSHTQASLLVTLAQIIMMILSLLLQNIRAKAFAITIFFIALIIVSIPNFINHLRGLKQNSLPQ